LLERGRTRFDANSNEDTVHSSTNMTHYKYHQYSLQYLSFTFIASVTFDAVKVYTEQNETYLKPLNDNRQIKPP